MTLLVTGASGFVGHALLAQLQDCSLNYRSAFRHLPKSCDQHAVAVGVINDTTNWSVALQGIDIIIHLAARAHIMGDEAADPLPEYRLVNVAGTLNLARQAAAAGVKRFIFVSSIKVNGETTSGLQPFTESLTCEVHDPYGISKKRQKTGYGLLPLKQAWKLLLSGHPWFMVLV